MCVNLLAVERDGKQQQVCLTLFIQWFVEAVEGSKRLRLDRVPQHEHIIPASDSDQNNRPGRGKQLFQPRAEFLPAS